MVFLVLAFLSFWRLHDYWGSEVRGFYGQGQASHAGDVCNWHNYSLGNLANKG